MALFKLIQNDRAVRITRQAREAPFRNFMLPSLYAYDGHAHERIKTAMHEHCDANRSVRARDIAVVGPGDTWADLFNPIYECMGFGNSREQHENAGKFLGLILFEVMLEREDDWHIAKYEKGGHYDVESQSYEDYYVTHYFSVSRYIMVKMAERYHQNNIRHNRQSPGVEALASQLYDKWHR